MSSLEMIVNKFRKTKILVIGDVMLDHYLHGDASRLSPEVPVPVVHASSESYNLGGAANVAANITALGGKVYLGGIIGDDRYGQVFANMAAEKGIESLLCVLDSMPTTVKQRIIANGHQLLRVDFEKDDPIQYTVSDELYNKVMGILQSVDVVVLSDYNKGIFSSGFAPKVINAAKELEKPVLVDPKPVNMGYFTGVDCITPNLKEALEIAERPKSSYVKSNKAESLRHIASKISLVYHTKYVTITCGRDGIFAFKSGGKGRLLPARAKEIYDVTGAGDTALAAMAMAWAAGADIYDSCRLANIAGGIVVGKLGTATLSRGELRKGVR